MERSSVRSPVRGEWKVIHNPGDTPYARDFVGLRPGRRLPYSPKSLPLHVLYRTPASAAFGWNRPVYAPFDGDVSEARDGYADTTELNIVRDLLRNVVFPPDLDETIQRFAGNYVVLEGAEAVAFLAHLQRNSVRVTAGDSVKAGERIGTIGNAGASLLPHLHFQLLREWPSDVSEIAANDRRFSFREYERWNGRAWETVRNATPKSGDRIRVTR